MRGIKRNEQSFVECALKQHGTKYDYSKIKYINTDTKVCIICSEHGEFWQTPNEHLKGCGCPVCAKNTRRKTNEQFINEARLVHGDKYDYSKVKYINNKTKVCIICPIHGEFYQAPAKHLMDSQGCPKCNKRGNKKKIVKHVSFTDTTDYKEKFIKEATIKHNGKYDYSKVEYINNNKKVCIICPIHGEFYQAPHYHSAGRGCPKCGRKIITTETFIESAKSIYGDSYIYSQTQYINRKTPIKIICPEHGEFQLSPLSFLTNKKSEHCPICATKKNVNETKLFEVLQKAFPMQKIIRGYRNYKILGRKEIDIYFPQLKIGIEYQGQQHFRSVDIFGGEETLQKQLKRDIIKIDECINNNIKLFHFSYDTKNIENVDYHVYTDDKILIEKIRGYL